MSDATTETTTTTTVVSSDNNPTTTENDITTSVEIQIPKLYETHVRPPSVKKRTHAIRNVLLPRLGQEHDQQLVQTLTSALLLPSTDYLWERLSQQRILELLSKLKDQQDASTMQQVLLTYSPRTTTAASVCVRMLCILFLKTKQQQEQVFAKLVSWCLYLLQARFDGDFQQVMNMYELRNVMLHVLSRTELVQAFVQVAAAATPLDKKFVAFQLLFAFASQAQIKAMDVKIFKLVADMVIENSGLSKEQIHASRRTEQSCLGFANYFAACDAQEVASIISKSFNRSRENTAPLLLVFAKAAAANLSAETVQQHILPCLLELLGNSKDESLRLLGVSLMTSLQQVDANLMVPILEKLLVTGGFGVPEKISTLHALTRYITKQVPANLCKILCSVIASTTESDTSRAQACETIYQLRHATFENVASLIAALEVAAFGKQSDAARVKALKALGSLLQLNQQALTKELTDKLCQLVIKSEQKVVERLLALYALRALLYGVTNSTNKSLISEVVNKQKAISAKVVEFLLNQEQVCQRLTTFDDFLVFAQVAEYYLLFYPQMVGLKDNDSSNREFFTHLNAALVIATATCTSKSDLQLLYSIILQIQKQYSMLLFDGFIALVDGKFYRDMEYMNEKKGEEALEQCSLQLRNALNDVLYHVAPAVATMDNVTQDYLLQVFTKVLHYAHHPDVRDNSRTFAKYVLHKVCQANNLNMEPLRAIIVTHVQPIVQHLISNVLLKQEEGASLRNAIGHALATFTSLFIGNNTIALLKENKARMHQHTMQQDAEASAQQAAIAAIYAHFAEQFQLLYNEFFEFDDEDIEVYFFVNENEEDATKVYHDVEQELMNNNPMFLQQQREQVQRYELTYDEWQHVFKQEDEMKKKNKSLNTETIRKKMITEKIREKEVAMRDRIAHWEDRLYYLASGFECMIQQSSKTSKILQHAHLSLVVMSLAQCMEIELTDELVNQVGSTFKTLCTQLCAPHPFSFLTADLIARLTFRLKRYESRTVPRTLRGRHPEVDDDVVFAEHVMNHLKINMRRNVDAESFAILVPLLQNLLHGEVLQLKGQIKAGRITVEELKKPMLILTAHVGLDGIRSGVIRPICCRILVEVLKSFPSLNKQADSAILNMAHFLLASDIDPLLDGLLAEQSNVRFSVLKALHKYRPLTDASALEAEQAQNQVYHGKASDNRLMHLLWMTQFDQDADHQEQRDLAKLLWTTFEQRNLSTQPEKQWCNKILDSMYDYMSYQEVYVKQTCATAFTAICKRLGNANCDLAIVLQKLFQIYQENRSDANCKLGVALVLEQLTTLLSNKAQIEQLFNFLINEGLRDSKVQDDMVKVGMRLVHEQGKQFQEVLLTLFNKFLEKGQEKSVAAAQQQQPQQQQQAKKGGKPQTTPTTTTVQQQPAKSKFGKASDDYVLGCVVVFMGTLASFYPIAQHEKMTHVMKRLIEALKIQSEAVQRAVCDSLTTLFSKLTALDLEKQRTIIQPVVDELLVGLVNQTSTFGERKGFSYGIVGIVAGVGIGALKQYDVMTRLRQVFSKKATTTSAQFPDLQLQPFVGQATAREGVLIIYELLAKRVKTFEPYFIEIIPHVLDGLADSSNAPVRQAAQDAANSLMGKLSGHGVRIIMPNILANVKNDDSSQDWRVKSTAIQLLGAMAYASPRQLSEHLPIVVKTLTEAVLTDTDQTVQQAAIKALERVGGVVQNPEIVQVVPQLLQALTKPSTQIIDQVLEGLLYTRFLHSIDAASLSLVVPVVCRALKERHSETKRKGAQIVGSISNLTTNPSDLLPYVSDLIPLLQSGIIDPQPTVRQSCAKAVGVLARSLGEQRISSMMDWLHENLEQNTYSSVERSGAAQTMSEIIAAQGVTRLQQLLPSLLQHISKPNAAHVRKGYMQVFVYIPALMKSKFEPYLTDALPKILEGLSDSDEEVRSIALNSSKVIVDLYATSAIGMLIPALINGMQSMEYRIRESTLMLLTEFLRRISRQYEDERKPKKQEEEAVEEEEEDNEETSTETGDQPASAPKIPAILIEKDIVHLDVVENLVGKAVLDQLVALMFILQHDHHLGIKSKAKSLWKSSVSNTSRMLRTILHTLIGIQVKMLASESEELRDQAARAMSETVIKVGEKVLADIIPLLHGNLTHEDSNKDTRFGACIGLKELLQTSSEKSVTQHQKKLMAIVRRAVCDPDLDVQQAGSEIFDSLFRILGFKIVSELLAQLFVDLKKEGDDKRIALAGLQQLLRVRGQQLLSKIIPLVLEDTSAASSNDAEISEGNAQILAAVVESSNDNIVPYIQKIVTPLIRQLGKKLEAKVEDSHFKSLCLVLQKLAIAIPEDELLDLVEMYVQALQATRIPIRLGGAQAVQCFFEGLVEADVKQQQQQQQQQFKKKASNDDDDDDDDDDDGEAHGLYGKFIPMLLENLIRLYNDPVIEVTRIAVRACNVLVGAKQCLLKPDQYADFIALCRDTLRELTEDDQGNRVIPNLPGFSDVPNGLDPFLTLFIHGLTNGKTPELREQSALGLGDLVDLTFTKSLTSGIVMKMIGALIRIVGERFPWQVKEAILKTTSLLLEKSGPLLKAFLPQLQTTFIKSLQDPNVEVRSIGAKALGKLVAQPGAKIDAIINELHTALKQMMQKKQSINMDNQLQGVLLAMLLALDSILNSNATVTMPKQETSLEPLMTTLIQFLAILSTTPFGFDPASIEMRNSIAQRLGTLARILNNASKVQTELIEQEALASETADDRQLQAKLLLTNALIQHAPERIAANATKNVAGISKLLQTVKSTANCALQVRQASMQVASAVILGTLADEELKTFCIQLLNHFVTNSSDNAVRYEAIKFIKLVCKKADYKDNLMEWCKTLLFCTKDKYVPIKLASERALMYLFNLHQNQQHIAKQYVQTCTDAEEQKILKDYLLKVVKNLETEDSEAEQ